MKIPRKYGKRTQTQAQVTPTVRAPTNTGAGLSRLAQSMGNLSLSLRNRNAQQEALDKAERQRAQREGEEQAALYKQEQDQFIRFDRQKKLSEFQTNFQRKVIEAKESAVGPALNFADTIDELYETEAQAWLKENTASNDIKREEYAGRFAQMKTGVLSDSLNFEFTQKHAYYKEELAKTFDSAKTRLDQQPELLETELEELDAALAEASIPEFEKAQLRNQMQAGLASVVYKTELRRKITNGKALGVGNGVKIPALDAFLERTDLGNLPEGLIQRTAFIESSGNLNAVNGQHVGLFQVGEAYKKDFGITDPKNIPDVTAGVIRAYKQFQSGLKTVLKREPSAGELYLAHQQGFDGASKLLLNPNAKAADLVGLEEITGNGGEADMTAREYADMWINKFEGSAPTDSILEPIADIPIVARDGSQNINLQQTDPAVLERLKKVQNAVGRELPIISAFRDVEHNKTAGGASQSRHTHGDALDLDVSAYSIDERKELIEKFSAAGFTGIGVYDNTIHVDTAQRRAWGSSHKRESVPKWAEEAISAHLNARAAGTSQGFEILDADPRFSAIPFEDRVALRQDADRIAAQEIAFEQQQIKASLDAKRNALYTEIAYGDAGRLDLDKAIEDNILTTFEQRKKAEKLLADKEENIQLEQRATQKYFSSNAIWNGDSAEDMELLNTLVDPTKITAENEDYFSASVVPIVDNTNIIPEQVRGTLRARYRQGGEETLFALEAMDQLRAVSPQAFKDSFNDEEEKAVAFYNARKGFMPISEIKSRLERINDPARQDEVKYFKEQANLFLKENPPEIESIVEDIWGGVFTADPAPPTHPRLVQELQNEYEIAVKDAFQLYQNPEEAAEFAKETLKKTWGPITRPEDDGYIWDSKVIMKHPPHLAGYKEHSGSMNWLWAQLEEERGNGDDELILISDEQTDAEIRQSKQGKRVPASYLVARNRNGVMMIDPTRIFFEPTEEVLEKEKLDFTIADLETRKKNLIQQSTDMAFTFKGILPQPVLEEIRDNKLEVDSLNQQLKALRDNYKPEKTEFDQLKEIFGAETEDELNEIFVRENN